MKVFVIDRKFGDYGYGDNYSTVVIAEDALHAERKVRLEVSGWRNAKLYKPVEIELNEEKILSVQNTGG